MSKKHKEKKQLRKDTKRNFMEIYWEKFIIVLLLVLPLIYFSSFLSPNRMIAGSDYLIGGYPFEKWIKEQDEMPLWYSHVFGGIPVLGAPVGGPLAPLAQLNEIIQPHIVLTLKFIIFFFIAGLGMYLYLKEIGLSKYSAIIGAVIFQFIGNLATTPAAGHAGRATSIAVFPLMLFFIHSALRSKKLLYFILMAMVTAFAFYEGHFQMTYYALLFIIGYVIYYLISHRKEISKSDLANIFVYGLSAIVLIGLLMAVVWLPVIGGLGTAARGVERGYAYSTSWSMPPFELIDLFIPTYSGLLDNYWGFNHFKIHLEYFGFLPLIFAIFTILLFWKKHYVKYYSLKILVILLVALGGYTPFFRIYYTIIPGFRLFRAPALVFFLVSFCFVVLGTIGFENIFVKKHEDKEKEVIRKRFYIIAGILLAIFILTGLICAGGRNSVLESMQRSFGPKFVSLFGPQMAQTKLSSISANYPQFVEGIWRGLIFLGVILVMIYVGIKKKIKPWIFAIAAIAIALIDQLPLMSKYLPSVPNPKVYYAADDVVNFLKRDQSIYRVFPFQYEHDKDSYLLYHNIQSAGGYIPNPIQRYQEFIGAGTSVMFTPLNLVQYPKFVDILNAKYIIAPNLPEDISRYDVQVQRYINEMKGYLSRFNRAFIGQKYSVYLNDSVLPRAYIVADYQVLEEPEILDTLISPQFNPRQTVILEENPGVPKPKEELPLCEAKITNYSANKIICKTECPYSGFLVLIDNWHPDWQVFVDGEKSKLYQANYTFRAVYLTAGKHEIIFAYISPYFNLGKIISIAALILSIVFCIFVFIPIIPLKK